MGEQLEFSQKQSSGECHLLHSFPILTLKGEAGLVTHTYFRSGLGSFPASAHTQTGQMDSKLELQMPQGKPLKMDPGEHTWVPEALQVPTH